MKEFPINVFPDVKRNEFKKFTKKNVTEDYIKENLKNFGWECYKPFTDTGLDLIITKKVLNKKEEQIRIYRYIQIKTRELNSDNKFGYTLKSKDFITDPRKFYFLYCDSVDDVIIISNYDYFKIFYDNDAMGKSAFANHTFRTNNNKLNSLQYSSGNWLWKAKGVSINFDKWKNINGLEKMENLEIDENYEFYLSEICKMKFELFYQVNKTDKNSYLFYDDGESLNLTMTNMKTIADADYILKQRKIENDFKLNHKELYESHLRYIVDEDD